MVIGFEPTNLPLDTEGVAPDRCTLMVIQSPQYCNDLMYISGSLYWLKNTLYCILMSIDTSTFDIRRR